MERDEDTVRCLALPIVGGQLLVPNALVAEVFAAEDVTPADGGPAWLLGSVTWRGRILPLVCMEAAVGGAPLEAGRRSKVVVMNAFTASAPLENFAVLVQGIPHQVLATDHTVQLETTANGVRPFVAADLRVDGEEAFVPDMDAVEKALLDAADHWRRAGSGGGRENASS